MRSPLPPLIYFECHAPHATLPRLLLSTRHRLAICLLLMPICRAHTTLCLFLLSAFMLRADALRDVTTVITTMSPDAIHGAVAMPRHDIIALLLVDLSLLRYATFTRSARCHVAPRRYRHVLKEARLRLSRHKMPVRLHAEDDAPALSHAADATMLLPPCCLLPARMRRRYAFLRRCLRHDMPLPPRKVTDCAIRFSQKDLSLRISIVTPLRLTMPRLIFRDYIYAAPRAFCLICVARHAPPPSERACARCASHGTFHAMRHDVI